MASSTHAWMKFIHCKSQHGLLALRNTGQHLTFGSHSPTETCMALSKHGMHTCDWDVTQWYSAFLTYARTWVWSPTWKQKGKEGTYLYVVWTDHVMYMYQKVNETHSFVQGIQEYMLVIIKIKEDLQGMRTESSKQSLAIFGSGWQHVLWTIQSFPTLLLSWPSSKLPSLLFRFSKEIPR